VRSRRRKEGVETRERGGAGAAEGERENTIGFRVSGAPSLKGATAVANKYAFNSTIFKNKLQINNATAMNQVLNLNMQA
jgi:hypothetical protein